MCTIPADSNGVSSPAAETLIAVDETVTVTCNSGFVETGTGTRTCQAAGTLSGSASTCGKKCFFE
jgi:hypothetical protein